MSDVSSSCPGKSDDRRSKEKDVKRRLVQCARCDEKVGIQAL